MKKIIMSTILVLFAVSGFPQGLEDFANYPETASLYHDGTFTGQDGSVWTYWQCRGDSAIQAPTPTLGKNRTPVSEIISGTIHNGCGTLSFDYKQVFTSNVNLEVFVNGMLLSTATSSSQQGVILNSGSIQVNMAGDVTISFRQKTTTAGQVAIDNITWSSWGANVLPEPSEYPSAFAAASHPFKIVLNWTDAGGIQEPGGYLIMAGNSDSLPIPADGFPLPDDADLSDGEGVLNIPQGTETAIFTGLPSDRQYYFRAYSYTNDGPLIDYKTDGDPPAATSRTPNLFIINNINFNDISFDGWTAQDLMGDQTWEIDSTSGISGSGCALMSGYSSGVFENEDWFLSPPLDFETYVNMVLNFESAMNFPGPPLELKISDSYKWDGDPNDADWSNLEAAFSAGGYAWTNSGDVDLSPFTGDSMCIAFRYTSGTAEASAWLVDDIVVTGEAATGKVELPLDRDGMTISPNPSEGLIRVSFRSEARREIEVISPLGMVLMRSTGDTREVKLDCTSLAPGIYIVKTACPGSAVFSKKLIMR
jgi:hypothetical protein